MRARDRMWPFSRKGPSGFSSSCKAEETWAYMVKEIPSAKVDTMELDIGSMTSVRKFAADLILFMATPFMLSKDNIELQFKTTCESMREGRIVNVSNNITANSLHLGTILANLFRHMSIVNAKAIDLGRNVVLAKELWDFSMKLVN
ncbi:hypothetical protein P3X46_010410 [Hevea brasiliensis]|uniref:Uncharacterized protein n=1 Tax=Hevea brasiliensis TaxID=3981 RepID=A0ABQ9MDZ0_HEVBR|nr:hypothetical protein P3X46_010410 [Hevea brasiliensis]